MVCGSQRAVENERITFAVPFYRDHAYLTRTLASVLAQTDQAWEAVVCDDGSDAATAEVVESTGGGRIRYLRNPERLGLAGNFNRCIDVAETSLVCVLHADDELEPEYTATFREAATRHPRAAALFCRARIIDAESRPVFSLVDGVKRWIDPSRDSEVTLESEAGIRALLRGNFIMAPTLCFRKSVLRDRRFPEEFGFILDLMLTSRLLLEGETLVGLPATCYRYRRHESSETSRLTRSQLRFREESLYYDRMLDVAVAQGWKDCARLASQKRMLKLNVLYRTLASAGKLQVGDAWSGVKILREL
jgi:glycosyltransferase involved in cell wall biosynthesis